MVEPDMCIACWITKAINIHSEYVILIAFRLQNLLGEHASVLRYTYFACLVFCYRKFQFIETRVRAKTEYRADMCHITKCGLTFLY